MFPKGKVNARGHPFIPIESICVCVGEGHSPTHLFDDLHHLLDVGVVNLSLQPVGVIRVSERAGGPWEELGETKIPQGVGKMRNMPKGQEPGRGVIMETQGGFEGLLEAPGGPVKEGLPY